MISTGVNKGTYTTDSKQDMLYTVLFSNGNEFFSCIFLYVFRLFHSIHIGLIFIYTKEVYYYNQNNWKP